jgi:hypothetical protein
MRMKMLILAAALLIPSPAMAQVQPAEVNVPLGDYLEVLGIGPWTGSKELPVGHAMVFDVGDGRLVFHTGDATKISGLVDHLDMLEPIDGPALEDIVAMLPLTDESLKRGNHVIVTFGFEGGFCEHCQDMVDAVTRKFVKQDQSTVRIVFVTLDL